MSVDSGSRRRRSSAANLIDALVGVGKSLVNKVAPTAPNRYTYCQCFWHRFSFLYSTKCLFPTPALNLVTDA